MNKATFLTQLRNRLSGLPIEELEERLAFYSELIDDHTEEGLSEDEAIASIGTIEEVADRIIADTPLIKFAKERLTPERRLKPWEITLLVAGSPVWVPLAMAAFAVILSLYLSWWAILICFWAVFVSCAACGIGGIGGGLLVAINNNAPAGLTLIGGGLVCVGLSILLFFGCKAATKGALSLTKAIALWAKKRCATKEDAQ